MSRQRRYGQANTEYVVIIGLVAVGLIAIIGVTALVIKWNYSRSISALAGGDGTNQAAQVAADRERMESEVARAGGRSGKVGGFSEDEPGKAGSASDLSAYGPAGPPAATYEGRGLKDPEPDTVSVASYHRGEGTVTKYYDTEDSNTETSEFGAYVAGPRSVSGSPAKTAPSSGKVFGIPWWVWLLFLVILVVFFFLWATADQ